MEKITACAHQSDTAIGQIAHAIQEQDQGLNQVTTALTQIDQITQSSAAAAQTGAATSTELQGQAEKLRGSVLALNQALGLCI